MGLLTRLRSFDSKSRDYAASDRNRHSESSSGTSDFSLVSSSSQSSLDKAKPVAPTKESSHHLPSQRRASPNNRYSARVSSSSPLRQKFSAEDSPAQHAAGAAGHGHSGPNYGPLGHIGSHQTSANYTGDPASSAQRSNPPRSFSRVFSQRMASGLSSSSFEVSSADISGSSGNSGSDEENDTLQESHPYYQQWKTYYETLEKSKLDPAAVVAQQMSSAQPAISSRFLEQAKTKSHQDKLVLNSRRSTLKSNRSASVPSLGHAQANPHTRAVSINASSTGEPAPSKVFEEFDFSDNQPERSSAAPNTPAADSRLSNADARNVSPVRHAQSSSPGKNAQAEKSPVRNQDQHTPAPNSLKNDASRDTNKNLSNDHELASPAEIKSSQSRRDISQISDYAAYMFYDDDEEDAEVQKKPSSPSHDMSRAASTASASSYNSLQSEKQFSVGRHPSRIATPAQNKRSPQKTEFLPPMQGPPPPLYPNMFNGAHQSSSSFADFNRQSMMDPMNQAYMQQMQQQIMQLQQMQQMHHLGNGPYQPQFSAPKADISSDAGINARIEEFVTLRHAIASGNKTLEFRVSWLKMLVCAVNYKLFSYINIRGEPIAQEQISQNKQFFIKSTQTHLQKVLRELDTSRVDKKAQLFGEICYIQGCLYSQTYLERFYQDFGIEKNDEEAERYFKLAIEYDPMCFKAYYELGELYESQDLEDNFDLALDNYKESAKLGYNRAIYKVALIYLVVPKVRSMRYFRYFKNLADIDMESQEIQLSGIDLEELEQVVGLAQFQLGKIYEGIYPGDLTIEDQFVVESLELAPVNYAKSLSYYNRAAKLSCLQAQVKLGHVYESGELNRPYNAVKSIQWYIKAATSPLKFKRHPEAMLGISRWFMKGTDGESKHIPFKDVQMAIQWCERACKEFASAEALFQMGCYMEEGFVMGDPEQYFREAAEMGHESAMQKLHPEDGFSE